MPNLSPGFGFGGILGRTLPPKLRAEAPEIEFFEPGSDRAWMRDALEFSMQSVGITNPNPAVGCVVVKGGKVVARGATEAWGGRHAERVAFEDAQARGVDLAGATAYVTLEPCSHEGRQPPCAPLLASSPIARVVVATGDPNPLVGGGGLAALRAAGKQVDVGVLEAEAKAWHFPFMTSHILNRPVIVGKWAQTLDGCLADDSGHSKWITGPAARAYGHWLRQKYDVIALGANTWVRDRPTLTARDCAQPIVRQPLRVVFDPRGRLRPEGLPADVVLSTAKAGTDPVGAFLEFTRSPELEARLGRPVQSIYVEGGATLLNWLLDAQAIDLAHVFIAPRKMGGQGKYRIGAVKGMAPRVQTRLGPDEVIEFTRV